MNPVLSGGAVTGGMVGSGMGHGMRDRLNNSPWAILEMVEALRREGHGYIAIDPPDCACRSFLNVYWQS